jgi:transposase
MGYDKKFREAVLRHVDAGHSQEETRKLFRIGMNTITKWKKLQEETGSLGDRPLNRKWRKIDPELLREDVEKYPDDFDKERAERFGCSEDGICKALKRLKIPRKKNGRIRGER